MSSGATLEANNLEATETLMESEAVLISSNDVDDTNFFDLVNRFKGVINAKDSKYVMLNCDESNIKKYVHCYLVLNHQQLFHLNKRKNLLFMRYVKNQSFGRRWKN
ncbi:MAG: hypothetical protein CM15mP126_2780 [Gammaproteobacteria bacterium]|nr:MAG: hypothetical protein CM15mP126_2780 [Gammaproteobacteria bacterium]